MTITGTNFTGATAVSFNGMTAASFTVTSATSISATVPLGATTGAIAVTTPNGTGTSTTNFTVTTAPTITSFTPTSGPVGTSVTITGTNFTPTTTVAFNGISAASVAYTNSTSLTATVPTNATTGTISVANGAASATSTGTFTVTAPIPTITSFTPTSGPVGTSVTITGTNFSGAMAVSFGGTAATTFSVASATSITATVPTGAATGTIAVSTAGGTAISTSSFIVVVPTAPTGVATTAASAITATTATAGGSITADGGSAVTARGVVYGTSASPRIGGTGVQQVADSPGTGTGTFTSSLTGLTASTTYYVAAYATNAVGTTYGSDISFATTAPVATPLLAYNFDATTTPEAPSTQDATVTGGNFTRSNVTATATAGAFNSTGWPNPATATIDLTKYVFFTFNPNAGYKAALTSLVFQEQRSGTGPATFEVRSSLDNYSATLATGSTTNGALGTQTISLGSAFSSIPSSGVTFRIYGYGASASGGTWRQDNVALYGTTTPDTTPTLTATPNTFSFAAVVGQAATGTYTLTGQYLGNGTAVTIGSNNPAVLVSLNGTTFAQTAMLTADGSGSVSQVVTVQYTAPAPAGTATSATIGNASGNLSAPVTVTGTSQAPAIPVITSFSPTSGPAGTQVYLTGTDFTGATSVYFNGVAAAFTAYSSTSITATVPTAATTGPISVKTANGTGASTTSFTVTTGAVAASPAGLLTLEEDFDYTPGDVLTAHGWAVTSSGTNAIAATAGNQTLPQYPVGNGGALTSSAALSTTGQDVNKAIALPANTSTFYTAAIINLSAAQATGDYFLHLLDNTTIGSGGSNVYRGKVFAKLSGSGYVLGLSMMSNASASQYTTQTYSFGTPYLVVIKYEQNQATGNDDAVSMYVFQTPGAPITEPSVPTIGPITEVAAADAPGLNAVGLRQGGMSDAPTLKVDGIRVATGWGAAVGRLAFVNTTGSIAAGSYHSLRVTGAATVATITGAAIVENTLNLDGGKVATSTANSLTLRDGVALAVDNGGASYVDGPLIREAVGGPSLQFPIGRGGSYRPLMLNITNAASGTTAYTAEQTEAPSPDPTNLTAPLVRVSKVRYFTITPNPVPAAGVFSGSVQLSFGADDQVTDPSALSFVIAKYHDSSTGWVNIGRGGGNSSTTLTSDQFTDFSYFALASTTPDATINPLPVTLTSFGATRQASGAVQVTWTTASELHSAYFEVQRSLDGSTFAPVDKVAANGTTAQAHTYATLDTKAPATKLYYRLRQVDTDGTESFSPVVTLAATEAAATLALYPNPAHSRLTVAAAAGQEVQVIDLAGRVLQTATLPASGQLSVESLPAGTYLLRVPANGQRRALRFTKE